MPLGLLVSSRALIDQISTSTSGDLPQAEKMYVCVFVRFDRNETFDVPRHLFHSVVSTVCI